MVRKAIRKEQEVFEVMQLNRDNYMDVIGWLAESGIDSYLYEDKKRNIFQLRYESSGVCFSSIDENYYIVKNEYYELEVLNEEDFKNNYIELQNEG